jgi:prepilin-type N-terminal cleavage/methylation domain-containing protein/prepilin-type processing-associated H-X9-DG protein
MSRRKGFTLVELLVVIGIIAVLIGILMPGLQAARRQANSVKCMSALKEIGSAFNQYAVVYKGVWPMARHDQHAPPETYPLPTGRQLRWQDRLLPFISNSPMDANSMVDLTFNAASNPDILTRMRETVLWGCPEWRKQNEEGLASSDNFRSGYSMNAYTQMPENTGGSGRAYVTGAPGSANSMGRYFKVTQWTKPSDRLLIADGVQDFLQCGLRSKGSLTRGAVWYPFDTSLANIQTAHIWFDTVRHGPTSATSQERKQDPYSSKRWINALFCDGHVQPVSITEGWQAQMNPGGEIWWTP